LALAALILLQKAKSSVALATQVRFGFVFSCGFDLTVSRHGALGRLLRCFSEHSRQSTLMSRPQPAAILSGPMESLAILS
jgi:hypothetical protein